MAEKKKPQTKKAGFLPFFPLVFALPGAIASILGLILPFAARLTKNPATGNVVRDVYPLSRWSEQHRALCELGLDGFRFFEAARGFAWGVAIAAGLLLLLLLWSRFDRRSAQLSWSVAVCGVLLALASILAFLFAVLFSVSAGGEESRVLLSVAAYLTLSGGLVTGVSAFLAVRRSL